jgi:citrate lyase beta subunit
MLAVTSKQIRGTSPRDPSARNRCFVPGSNARALEKARNLPADGIILDLEDSVAPDAKAMARDQIAQAIAQGGFGKREVLIRVNALDSPWWIDDVTMAGKARPDGILVPKVSSVEDLTAIANRLGDINADISIRVWAMIETARAVLHAEELAAASRFRDPAGGLRVRAERYFAGDANPHPAGPRGDDPDDHALHSGDPRLRP